jgi:hypothetical protein
MRADKYKQKEKQMHKNTVYLNLNNPSGRMFDCRRSYGGDGDSYSYVPNKSVTEPTLAPYVKAASMQIHKDGQGWRMYRNLSKTPLPCSEANYNTSPKKEIRAHRQCKKHEFGTLISEKLLETGHGTKKNPKQNCNSWGLGHKHGHLHIWLASGHIDKQTERECGRKDCHCHWFSNSNLEQALTTQLNWASHCSQTKCNSIFHQ